MAINIRTIRASQSRKQRGCKPEPDLNPTPRVNSFVPRMERATLGRRLRYSFDNTMAKGPVALIAWLGVLSLGVILIATGIIVALKIAPSDRDGDFSPFEAAWASLMRTLDPGTMGG